MATINYWGLTGVKASVTVALTVTIDQLISAIAADEGLPTDYYKISLLDNPAINDTIYGDSSTPINDPSVNMVDGDTILCTPNQVGTKEDRQIQKLDIAAATRAADGNPRATYDITQLPTKYTGNNVVDNPNSGGLLENRPWATVASPIVTTGLIVNLDAGDTDSYPGSGTTWTNLVDSTPYTITNGAYDSGNGGSIVFDGTSTFVAIGTPLSNGTNFTKEAWVWADVVTSSRNILSSESNVLWNNTSTLSAGVGNSYSLVTSASFPTGVWRHVAQTFNDTTNTMTLYINGVQISQNTSVTQSYISQIERVGAHYSGGSVVSFWDGKIAQVRVYDTALTDTDIAQNYDAEKSRYGL